jgi:hypothetical protein
MTHSLITTTAAGGTLSGITGLTTVSGPPSVKISEVVYTNTNPFIEREEIFFKANDGIEDSAAGTITVLLENSAPVATNQTVSCKSGEFISFDLDVKDPDHMQEELTYTSSPIEYAADGTTTIIQPPTDGLIYFNRSGSEINAPGKAVYSNNGEKILQQEIIKYRVTDPEGDSDTAQLTINLTSDPLPINQLDNRAHQVTQGAGSTSPIVLEGRSPTAHTPLQFLLTAAPTGGTLHYQSNFSDTAITASETNVLSSGNLYFNHTASNSNDTQFSFKAKDTLNNIGPRGIVEIIVNAVVNSNNFGIYGEPFHTADDTQSGTANITSKVVGTGFSGTNITQTRTSLSIITNSQYNTFSISALRTSAAGTTITAFQIQIYSDSARTNLVTQTSAWTGNLFLTNNTFQSPWGSLTLSPGTYFVKFTYTFSGSTNANQNWHISLS